MEPHQNTEGGKKYTNAPGDVYLEPKWPLFSLEKTLFWRVQQPK